MHVSLKGKVILVTGAAKGIGAAIAKEAANAGSDRLMLTDRDADALVETAKATGASAVAMDLTDADAPQKLLTETQRKFGRIDCLVNAAGLTDRGSVADADIELWDKLFAINARAPFFLMQRAIVAMHSKGTGGAIVNILSMNAHCGAPELAVYAATKAALSTLTKNAANAFMADNIRVNGINVGWVATESEHHMQSKVLGKGENWEKQAAEKQPLGRLLNEKEVARHAVFQISDASAPMTGVCMDLEQKVLGA